jgi:glutaminyl-tRNA synthetase
MAVLDPIKLVLTNWDETFGAGHLEPGTLPALPHPPEGQPEPAARQFTIGKEVWIERDDFAEQPPKGYKRLSPPITQADGTDTPGSIVRLKAGYIVQCTGCLKDGNGTVTEVHATVFTDTKSGSAGADSVKAKGVITWVGVSDGVRAQVRLYDRLFNEEQPDAGGRDFLTAINPDSLKIQEAWVEPSLLLAKPDDKFQFERLGYFVADRVDHQPSHLVFNRAVSLKDNWSK